MKRQSYRERAWRKVIALFVTFCLIVGLFPGVPVEEVAEAAASNTNLTETI